MAPSELILNPDGSIYHLHLRPEQVADTIITVGDPDRVHAVSKYFDRIDEKVQKREFVTHTGTFKGQRMTVISTGIGTDNIDIVLNELDALATIDLDRREVLANKRQLTFVRIGTSGALQADLGVDSWLASSAAIGLDGLLHFYDIPAESLKHGLLPDLDSHLRKSNYTFPIPPYWSEASTALLRLFDEPQIKTGITLTALGFYAPQGRELRLPSRFHGDFIHHLVAYRHETVNRNTNL
ncbi:MAG: nucleoside phosphorylase [Bacteroidota bacterium]